ncbi:MAG: hypothetical protein WA761_05490 [Thermoplasmata archaeon]
MAPSQSRRRTAASVLTVLAILLLISSLFLSWYQISVTLNGLASVSNTQSFYLTGHVATNDTQCQGTVCQSTSASPSYSSQGYQATGDLYEAMGIVALLAIILAFLAGLTSLASRRSSRRWVRSTVVLTLLALLVTISIPVGFVLAQPDAMAQDASAHPDSTGLEYNNTSVGPGDSYFGSCTNTTCGANTSSNATIVHGGSIGGTWGPSIGWYVGWAAAGLLAASLVIFPRGRTAGGTGAPEPPADRAPEPPVEPPPEPSPTPASTDEPDPVGPET